MPTRVVGARWPRTVSGALAEGVTDTELAALEDQDAERFDQRTWAALAWADARTRADLGPVAVGLVPHPATELSEWVLLVEGPPGMISARSAGLPAIAVPGDHA